MTTLAKIVCWTLFSFFNVLFKDWKIQQRGMCTTEQAITMKSRDIQHSHEYIFYILYNTQFGSHHAIIGHTRTTTTTTDDGFGQETKYQMAFECNSLLFVIEQAMCRAQKERIKNESKRKKNHMKVTKYVISVECRQY